jgi:hypothetical protein
MDTGSTIFDVMVTLTEEPADLICSFEYDRGPAVDSRVSLLPEATLSPGRLPGKESDSAKENDQLPLGFRESGHADAPRADTGS